MLILDEPTEGIQPSVVAEIEQTITSADRAGGLAKAAGGTAHRFRPSAPLNATTCSKAAGHLVGTGGAGAEQKVREAMTI